MNAVNSDLDWRFNREVTTETAEVNEIRKRKKVPAISHGHSGLPDAPMNAKKRKKNGNKSCN